MVIKVAEKIVPTVVKAIGKEGAIQLIGVASVGGGLVNFIMDKTLGPVIEKGTNKLKNAIANSAEKKKADLEEKRAAIQAQKKAVTEVEIPEEEVVDEEKPKKASVKKKNK